MYPERSEIVFLVFNINVLFYFVELHHSFGSLDQLVASIPWNLPVVQFRRFPRGFQTQFLLDFKLKSSTPQSSQGIAKILPQLLQPNSLAPYHMHYE